MEKVSSGFVALLATITHIFVFWWPTVRRILDFLYEGVHSKSSFVSKRKRRGKKSSKSS